MRGILELLPPLHVHFSRQAPACLLLHLIKPAKVLFSPATAGYCGWFGRGLTLYFCGVCPRILPAACLLLFCSAPLLICARWQRLRHDLARNVGVVACACGVTVEGRTAGGGCGSAAAAAMLPGLLQPRPSRCCLPPLDGARCVRDCHRCRAAGAGAGAVACPYGAGKHGRRGRLGRLGVSYACYAAQTGGGRCLSALFALCRTTCRAPAAFVVARSAWATEGRQACGHPR